MGYNTRFSRRRFLKLGALCVTSATILGACQPAAPQPAAKATEIPPAKIEVAPTPAGKYKGKINLALQMAEVVPGKPKEPGQLGWEWILEAYKKAQPDVTIETTIIPAGDLQQMADFIKTHQAAANMPDLVNHWVGPTNREEDENKSPWVSTTPYLEEKNPYTGKLWKDDIAPDILAFQLGTLKFNYALAVNKGQGMWVYNKTMFDEKGWKTPAVDKYSEFQALLDTIKTAGIIPIAEWATPYSGFTDHPIRAYLNSLQRHQWTKVAGKPDIRWITTQQNYEGFYCGVFTYQDPGVKKAYELAKFLNLHAPPGHWSLNEQQVRELFYAKKAAIIWAFTGWARTYERLKGEGQIDFEFDTFRTPDFDQPTIGSLEAYPVQDLGERGRQWAVPNTSFRANKDPGQEKMAVDFLQHWIAPEQQSGYCGLTYSLPVNPATKMNVPVLELWRKNPNGWYQQYRSDLDHAKWFQHWQAFVEDKTSYDQYASTMDTENKADAERLAQEQKLQLSCDKYK